MSEIKDTVQVKVTLTGPMKDFLEQEAEMQCRKLTGHIRYIINQYYAERMRTLGSQSGQVTNFGVPVTNHYEPQVLNTNQHEPLVPNTNQYEPQVLNTNQVEQESSQERYKGEEDVAKTNSANEEVYDYISDDVLNF